MGYGELALEKETDGMAEINLWDLIVVKLSELGILKRYYIYERERGTLYSYTVIVYG